MLEENTYDLVVGNPPYLATAKLADARYVRKHYALGKADLVAAFMIRGVELARPGGMSALLTMRNWMFLNQYSGLRKWLMETQDLRALHDLSSGAFEGIHAGKVVVSVVSSIVRKGPAGGPALALRVFEAGLLGHDETARKRSATLCQAGRSEFDPAALRVVPDWPLVYDWGLDDLDAYRNLALLGAQSPARQGLATANNARFLRKPWEVSLADGRWAPYIKGAAGRAWLASVDDVVLWADEGLEIEFFEVAGRPASRPQNREFYFRLGIAFSAIGTEFCARAHRSPAVFGNAGLSVFPGSPIELAQTLCSLNSTRSRRILESLNPTVNFLVGDVNRLPRFVVEHATEIVAVLAAAFAIHERHREPSIEFEQPGPSPWRHAQAWAQLAVDRPANTPLPAYERQFDGEPATDHLSFALGCALGRFESQSALPHGLLVLDGTLGPDPGEASTDSLGHPGSASLHRAWSEHATKLGSTRKRLRDYLRLEAFAGHRTRYENRPIHWPLSSANKTFVAWVTIRHLQAGTIRHLLAEFLHPILQRLDAELAEPRLTPRAQKRPEQVRAWRAELATFIADLSACAERGPPPPDATTPARTDDAAYEPDLDDGVRINAAALWPVLDPQWKDPKSWWKELARAEGRKDCDWSKLAARYFAARVDAKCRAEPSLALAHGCAEKYHPDRARAWALWRAKHAGHRT